MKKMENTDREGIKLSTNNLRTFSQNVSHIFPEREGLLNVQHTIPHSSQNSFTAGPTMPSRALSSLKPAHELTPSALKYENSGTLDDNLINKPV